MGDHEAPPSTHGQTFWQRCRSACYNTAYTVMANTKQAMATSYYLDPSEPVFLLGEMFDVRTIEGRQKMHDALFRVVLFTYRKDFAPILGNVLTYDTGWGCMLRTGQMMIYQMLCRALPRDRARHLDLFRDSPTAPFSIHRVCLVGQEKYGVRCGEWFSPSVMCHVFRDLVEAYMGGSIRVLVVQDSTFFTPEAEEVLASQSRPQLCVLFPLLLGLSGELSETYHISLLQCIEVKYSLGIVGGKPKISLYFVGRQGRRFIYLDPHIVQPAFLNGVTKGSLQERRTLLVEVSQLDPSLFLGFLLRDKAEYEHWIALMSTIISCKWPMFSMINKLPQCKVVSKKPANITTTPNNSSFPIDTRMSPSSQPKPSSLLQQASPRTLKTLQEYDIV